MEIGMALVEDASMVIIEFPIGVVVPKVDGVEVPETAPANCEKADAEILCLGDKVSELELLEETSTCKYTSALVEKL